MSAELPFPAPEPSDPEDVAWTLQTAGTMWARGDAHEAVRWLRRAAEAAGDAGNDERALGLARAAADTHHRGRASSVIATSAGEPGPDLEDRSCPRGRNPTIPRSRRLMTRRTTTASTRSPKGSKRSNPRAVPLPRRAPRRGQLPRRAPRRGQPRHRCPVRPPTPEQHRARRLVLRPPPSRPHARRRCLDASTPDRGKLSVSQSSRRRTTRIYSWSGPSPTTSPCQRDRTRRCSRRSSREHT